MYAFMYSGDSTSSKYRAQNDKNSSRVAGNNVTGFSNAEYDAKIDAAYAEQDMAKRAALLHEAEAILLEEMPVIPLLFNRSATLISNQLVRVSVDYYGFTVFTKTELRNYHKHLFQTVEQ